MRPPDSFSSAAPNSLPNVSGTSFNVGVLIFITKVLSCAAAPPSDSAKDAATTPATAPMRTKASCTVTIMIASLPPFDFYFVLSHVTAAGDLPPGARQNDSHPPCQHNATHCREASDRSFRRPTGHYRAGSAEAAGACAAA